MRLSGEKVLSPDHREVSWVCSDLYTPTLWRAASLQCASATQSNPSGLLFLYDLADKWSSFAFQAYSGTFLDHHSVGFLLRVLCLSGRQSETGWTCTYFMSRGEVRGCAGAWVVLSSCVLCPVLHQRSGFCRICCSEKYHSSAQILWRIDFPVQTEQVFLRISVILQRCWSCLCCLGEVGAFLVRGQQEGDEIRGTVPFLSCPPQLTGLLLSMVMCESQDLL